MRARRYRAGTTFAITNARCSPGLFARALCPGASASLRLSRTIENLDRAPNHTPGDRAACLGILGGGLLRFQAAPTWGLDLETAAAVEGRAALMPRQLDTGGAALTQIRARAYLGAASIEGGGQQITPTYLAFGRRSS